MAVELARRIGMWTLVAAKIARRDHQPEITPQPGQGSITLLRTLVFVHRPPSVVALFRGDVGLLLCGVNRA
jgi:hypothetical protein